MKGFVHKYGDHIDTDVIIPARTLSDPNPETLAKHCMEDIDKDFINRVKSGDIMIGGVNFGCGSSREHAPIAIKAAGISCVIAVNFARIFYRNAINIGLPVLECEDAAREAETSDVMEVNLTDGIIINKTKNRKYQAVMFPPFMQNIIDAGGLLNYIKKKRYKITILEGDGIGPEIMEQAVAVLDKVSEICGFDIEKKYALIGGCAIDITGNPLPDETIETCKSSDAVLLGAVGGSKWDNAVIRPEAGLLKIRSELNVYANLRPAIVYESLADASPLKREILDKGLNILIVRELTGGIYFGKRGRDGDYAFDTEEYNVSEIRRIAEKAFEMATKRSGKLCSVDKANVLATSKLWRDTVTETARNYPEVELTHMYVDNAAMQLVRAPYQFDTIVTSNMFGDILSDEASQITGSIGMLPSASLGDGTFGLYEPIHGSAPDIAGKGIANPIAMILSVAMLLRYSFNETKAADMIERAVENVLNRGIKTIDIAGDNESYVTTEQMGEAIINEIKSIE